MTHDAKTIAALSFEAAMQELETVVRALETGTEGLDGAIKAYEYGAALQAHCEAKLKEARLKIEKLSLATDGTISATDVTPS